MDEVESSGKSGTLLPSNARRPIWFPHWKSVLAATALPEDRKILFCREILAFLHHCKVRRAAATIIFAQSYLDAPDQRDSLQARPALRWFFRQGRCPPAPTPIAESPSEPAPDLAPAGDWEKDLIKAVRKAGLLWRTEETYRSWAGRFVRFIAPHSPSAADATEVAAFLTDLAVRRRVSPATQKQALNALVFFLQEGLHRTVGKIEFQRSRPQVRIPTVLSREECRRLFAELQGTPLLMAASPTEPACG